MLRGNQDAFDMAKLQKSIRRQHHNSSSSQYSVTRLSAAEIRDLNNAANASKNARLAQLNRSLSAASVPRSSPRTPPLSPEEAAMPRVFPTHHIYNNIPTPPISPDIEQKDLTFNNYAYPHTPNERPPSSAESSYSSSGPSRRPSTASSYRGVSQSPQSDSKTMFYDSAQQMSNPLLNFSRPYHGAPPVSFDRYKQEQPSSHRSSPYQKSNSSYQSLTDSLPSDQGVFPYLEPQQSSTSQKEIRHNDEEEERVGRESMRPPILQVRKKRSRSMPALLRDQSPSSVADSPLRIIDATSPTDTPGNYTALPQGLEGVPLQKPPMPGTDQQRLKESKQKRSWRKAFNNKPSKDRSQPFNKPAKPQVLGNLSNDSLISISYANTVAGTAPQMKDSLKEVLPSNQNSAPQAVQTAVPATSDFGQHPAVRPYSALSDNKSSRSVSPLPSNVVKDSSREEYENKQGQEPEDGGDTFSDFEQNTAPSFPTYSRCSCCGKLRKPAGFVSNLSPVLENEHLRTNFHFELGRSSLDSPQSCTSPGSFASRPKHIPIIPMEIDNQLRQARIEPYTTPYIVDQAASEEQNEISTPNSVVDSGFVTADSDDRLPPISRPETSLSAHRTPLVLTRGKDEPKVVRFTNMNDRRREIERRGRGREPKPLQEQEQMHETSQLKYTHPDNEQTHPSHMPADVIRYEVQGLSRTSSLSSSASSEIDLVSRMPLPPTSVHRNVTSSNSPPIGTPVSEIKTETVEPVEPVEPHHLDTAVELHPEKDEVFLENSKTITLARPAQQVIKIYTRRSKNNLNNIEQYAEVANSSPLVAEAPVLRRPDFYGHKTSNSTPNSSDEALPLPPPSSPNGRTTTIVRIINHPSTIPIPERSPKRPTSAWSNHEPGKLGDWILPTATSREEAETKAYQPCQHYAAMKFDGIVSAQEFPTPLSASSSRYNSLTENVMNPSSNSSFSIFQVQQAKNAQVSQVVTGGNGRVKEVGSNIARRMRAARRSVSARR